jgi:hypothetical protein
MANYMTIVVRLPADNGATAKVCQSLRLGGDLHGAEITGLSMEDEMTILELIEQHEDFDPVIADEARAQAKELQAAAEIRDASEVLG